MGVKGLTPGRENSLGGDHMVFRGNEGGIGCRTAEHKGGGGRYGKLREESQKYYGALRRKKVNFIVTQPESSKPPPFRIKNDWSHIKTRLCCEKRNQQKKSLFHDSSDTRENFEN